MTAARLHDMMDFVLAANIQLKDTDASVWMGIESYEENIKIFNGNEYTCYTTQKTHSYGIYDPYFIKAQGHILELMGEAPQDKPNGASA